MNVSEDPRSHTALRGTMASQEAFSRPGLELCEVIMTAQPRWLKCFLMVQTTDHFAFFALGPLTFSVLWSFFRRFFFSFRCFREPTGFS